MIGKFKYGVCLCVMTVLTYGADVSVKTSFNQSKISVNQNINLTIAIENSKDTPQFDFSELLDVFVAIGKNSETYYHQVNGHMDYGTNYIFTLKPIKTGSFEFKNLDIIINGQRYRSAPLHIDIEDHTAVVTSSKTGEPELKSAIDQLASQYGFFAVATIDKPDVYFGEKVDYTLDFYHRSHLFNVGAPNPDFSNFLAETLDVNTTPKEVVLAGRRFYKTRLKSTLLYPVNSGDMTIASVPIDFLSGSLLGGVRTVNTNSVTIHVRPLPTEGKPANFAGAVGQFALKGSVDKNVVDQYSPITLSLLIYGEGNLSAIQDIYFNKNDDFKIYQSKSDLATIDGIDGRLFEYIVVPNKSGTLVLPEFYLPYFSPKEEVYSVLRTSPFKLSVAPAKISDTSSSVVESDMKQDIHYLKLTDSLKNKTVRASDSVALLSCLFIGIVCFIMQILWRFRDKFMYKQSHKMIVQKRYSSTMKDLDAFNATSDVSVNDIEKSVREYLSISLKESLGSATIEHIQTCCGKHKLSDEVQVELSTLLQDMAYLAYSPSVEFNDKKNDLVKRCKSLILSIQKELS